MFQEEGFGKLERIYEYIVVFFFVIRKVGFVVYNFLFVFFLKVGF